jgi:N-acetylmuramoyl-L-alanine amidase
MSKCLILFLSTLLFASVNAAEIVLIYPRQDDSTKSFVYPDEIDSTFVLGHVIPPTGKLEINNQPVELNSKGAFLAYLPLLRLFGTKSWSLTLTEGGERIATLEFPYFIQGDLVTNSTESQSKSEVFPRVIEVTQPNAHTRTIRGGSYQLFPQPGTRLLANGHDESFFRFHLGNGFDGWIEDRFVNVEPDTHIVAAILGNGECSRIADTSFCLLQLNRPVPWTSELTPDGKSLCVHLFDTKLAIDRVRYDSKDDFLNEVTWEQKADGVDVEYRFRKQLKRGFEIHYSNGVLRLLANAPFERAQRKLKGKIIVLDPGHGGSSSGAIGALETKEKDVTLRWAKLLARILERKGAIVKVTRDEDVALDLYQRAAFAKSQRADFLISLHCNALPDGENPFVRHGTGTYYYHSASRSVAEVLHRQLLKTSGLRDDGLYDANLALVRPTAFPAVLIEAAYMIYPPEEELLQSDAFLQRLSTAIAKGLDEYFRRVQ